MTLHTEHNEVLGGDLRVFVDQNREIWFVASDVAKLLEYDSAKNLVRGLDPDERGSHNVTITSDSAKARKSQEMTIITEAGLYQVIMNAKTERVKPFKRWVTHEVLPQIRKTGKYGVSANVADDPFDFYMDRAEKLGRVGFSAGVQQAYLLKNDSKYFDETANHFLPDLAIAEAKQTVKSLTYDVREETSFACIVPDANFASLTVSQIAASYKDKRITTKVINDWLCEGGYQKRVARGKYVKLERAEGIAVSPEVFEGHTKGMNIIKSWRWVAELQQYLNECFVAFTNK